MSQMRLSTQGHKLTSADRSSAKSVFVSRCGSLPSLNPAVSFYAAGCSLHTGIKAARKINAVSLVILLDLQARLFDWNQCEEIKRLCHSLLSFCLSFSTPLLPNPPHCVSAMLFMSCFYSWWFLTSVTWSLCLFSVGFPDPCSSLSNSNLFRPWLLHFPHFLSF